MCSREETSTLRTSFPVGRLIVINPGVGGLIPMWSWQFTQPTFSTEDSFSPISHPNFLFGRR